MAAAARPGAEPWNRVRIPQAGSRRTLTVQEPSATLDVCAAAVIKGCHLVTQSLKSPALDVEVDVLCSVLYSNHNRLGRHKPHLALRQVEQCLKRLKNMHLEDSVEDLSELFSASETQPGATKKPCRPQPASGGGSTDEGFGGLQVVAALAGLLLQGIPIDCEALGVAGIHYFEPGDGWAGKQVMEVSSIQPMPYFKDFAFPSDITDFLGPPYLEVFNRKTPAAFATKGVTKLLNKLFLMKEQLPKINEDTVDRISKTSQQMKSNLQSSVDLGQPVKMSKKTKKNSLRDLTCGLFARGCETKLLSLPKKLQCMKTSLCNCLLRGTSKHPPRQRRSKHKVLSRQRKPQRKLQSTFLKEAQQVPEGTLKSTGGTSAKCRRSGGTVQRSDICPNGKQVLRRHSKPGLKTKELGIHRNPTGGAGNETGLWMKRQIDNAPESAKEADDIDDIFALMGV